MLDGETAFKLYDTYGFPLDLTQDALQPRGIASTRRLRPTRWSASSAKARALVGGLGRGRDRGGLVRAAREARRDRVPRLRDRDAPKAWSPRWSRDGKAVDRAASRRERSRSSLNQTPFYGESGGQVGDTGVIDAATACASRVTDTQKQAGDLFVHVGTVEQGALKVGDGARARRSITRAARDIRAQPFGDAPAARGAAPGARRSRRAEGLAGRARPAALRLLASQADDARRRSRRSRTSPTTSCCRTRRSTTRLMALDDALASGARALFGEKYGDEVRVVAMGEARRQHARLVGRAVRRHPCAAHRRHRPVSGRRPKRGVAAGVRRIEALTGDGARARPRTSTIALAKAAAAELKAPLDEMPARLAALLDERKQARARARRRAQEARDGRRRARPAASRTACAWSATSS